MTPPATSSRKAPSRGGRRGAPGRPRRPGRIVALILAVLVGVGVWSLVQGYGPVDEAVRDIVLPLRYEDVIRQQAREKDLDPALIAAVIYKESKFEDRTSPAGARGVMQVTPETAQFIARKSGGSAFVLGDLATPQVNISYGSWYLRYLRAVYDGDTTLAVAAYNAGATNVDRWVTEAGGREAFDHRTDIPFRETRNYVARVIEHRRLYRRHYRRELGIGRS